MTRCQPTPQLAFIRSASKPEFVCGFAFFVIIRDHRQELAQFQGSSALRAIIW
jgi:hypothetical protein